MMGQCLCRKSIRLKRLLQQSEDTYKNLALLQLLKSKFAYQEDLPHGWILTSIQNQPNQQLPSQKMEGQALDNKYISTRNITWITSRILSMSLASLSPYYKIHGLGVSCFIEARHFWYHIATKSLTRSYNFGCLIQRATTVKVSGTVHQRLSWSILMLATKAMEGILQNMGPRLHMVTGLQKTLLKAHHHGGNYVRYREYLSRQLGAQK